jgi:hypothetical protein
MKQFIRENAAYIIILLAFLSAALTNGEESDETLPSITAVVDKITAQEAYIKVEMAELWRKVNATAEELKRGGGDHIVVEQYLRNIDRIEPFLSLESRFVPALERFGQLRQIGYRAGALSLLKGFEKNISDSFFNVESINDMLGRKVPRFREWAALGGLEPAEMGYSKDSLHKILVEQPNIQAAALYIRAVEEDLLHFETRKGARDYEVRHCLVFSALRHLEAAGKAWPDIGITADSVISLLVAPCDAHESAQVTTSGGRGY